MKTKAAKTSQPAAKGQTPEVKRRINAGWLRLWKAVYPNTPPPVEVRSPKVEVRSLRSKVQSLKSKVQRAAARRPAAVDYLSRVLCAGFALALLASGCAGQPPHGRTHEEAVMQPFSLGEPAAIQAAKPAGMPVRREHFGAR
jgi:hypothetical protein